jgi:hypothetical protein
MEPKKHGFHLFEGKQPVDLTRTPFTYSADGKTFSLTYAFKSSTHYEVQMNSTEDIGFCRDESRAAVAGSFRVYDRAAALSSDPFGIEAHTGRALCRSGLACWIVLSTSCVS